jgi:protein translocase SecG subunit
MFETIFSWNTLYWLIQFIYLPSCIGLIVIVLLQKGKSMGFAGAFGVNPGGDTVLGPRASRSLPVRMTYFMAGAFMVLALLMAIIEGRRLEGVAPDLVDPEEVAAMEAIQSDLESLGVTKADTEEEAPPGTIESDPSEDPAPAPVEDAGEVAVDSAEDVEPEAPAEDSTGEGDAAGAVDEMQAEIEALQEDDVP